MSGRPPDQLAREVREKLHDPRHERHVHGLAALAELEAMASARNDDVSLLVGAYYGEVHSETMELAQAAARLRAAAAVSSPADQEGSVSKVSVAEGQWVSLNSAGDPA